MSGRTIPVEGGEIFCSDEGDGIPVVLMHAGARDLTMWDGQAEYLAPRCRVIRYDARGHGQSSTPGADYSHAADLLVLLDALEIDRAALVGLSLGARTAVDFALLHPDRVNGMVLAGPGVSGMVIKDPHVLACFDQQMEAVRNRDLDAWVEWNLRAWVDGPFREPGDVDPGVRERCRQQTVAWAMRDALGVGVVQEAGAISRLDELAGPVLAIHGSLDATDISEIVANIGASVPGTTTLLVPGAGHMVSMEAPDAFNEAVASFLDLRDGKTG